ncbi:hypothetical protein Tco_0788338 [Tanacetum coccineum]
MVAELQKMYGKPSGVDLQSCVNMFHSCKAKGKGKGKGKGLQNSYPQNQKASKLLKERSIRQKMDNVTMPKRKDIGKECHVYLAELMKKKRIWGQKMKRMQNVPYASANYGEAHWTAVYLRNTKDTFLVYDGNPEAELRGMWYEMLQTNSTTAQHATEAEYIAAKEAVWIRKFIDELGVVPSNLCYPL